jgi:threonine aldolase
MIDLRSDTVTKPDKTLLEEVLKANLGDDEYGEDPTVNALQEKCSKLFGFEDGLFVSSGLMGNQISLLIHNSPGTEVITSSDSHIKNYEHGAAAFLSRVQFREVDHIDGLLNFDSIEQIINKSKIHNPTIRTISIENTHLASGGSIIKYEDIKNLYMLTQSKGLNLHVDGARVLHSILQSKSPYDYGSISDSLTFCFSKALGAPIGSMLLGSKQFIKKAREYRKILGGGMRQVGVIASIANKALDQREAILQDHEKTRLVYESISNKNFCKEILYKGTNMIIFKFSNIKKSNEFIENLESKNVLAGLIDDKSVRIVFHKDVQMNETKNIIDAINYSSSVE